MDDNTPTTAQEPQFLIICMDGEQFILNHEEIVLFPALNTFTLFSTVIDHQKRYNINIIPADSLFLQQSDETSEYFQIRPSSSYVAEIPLHTIRGEIFEALLEYQQIKKKFEGSIVSDELTPIFSFPQDKMVELIEASMFLRI